MAEPTSCAHCGEVFIPRPFDRGRRFCSKRCYYKVRQRPPKTCIGCGQTFTSGGHYQKFCTRTCRYPTAWPPRRVKAYPACSVVYGTCRRCGKAMVSQRGRVLCSRECSLADNRERTRAAWVPVAPHPIVCRQCGVSFIGKRRLLCGPCAESNARAQKRAARVGRKGIERGRPYRRVDIFERDGWRCHLCGKATDRAAKVPSSKAPTIDHLVPLSAGGVDSPANVATAHFICNSRRSAGGVAQLRLVG